MRAFAPVRQPRLELGEWPDRHPCPPDLSLHPHTRTTTAAGQPERPHRHRAAVPDWAGGRLAGLTPDPAPSCTQRAPPHEAARFSAQTGWPVRNGPLLRAASLRRGWVRTSWFGAARIAGHAHLVCARPQSPASPSNRMWSKPSTCMWKTCPARRWTQRAPPGARGCASWWAASRPTTLTSPAYGPIHPRSGAPRSRIKQPIPAPRCSPCRPWLRYQHTAGVRPSPPSRPTRFRPI